ncbi:MAG: tetraacyldisaccharide 4'-kinase [Bacteroidia bacterium]|nr:tetraacyldisaccharide 4'-kinase [Bacteroidia bacterium]
MQILRFLLFPFALLYGIALFFRNLFYDLGIYPGTSFEMPLIVVGNLSMGGTGKSPHIEYLIRLLKKDHPLATLSRGYGRKSKGFRIAEVTSKAEEVGDEPLQFKKKFPDLPVAVNGNRVSGIRKLLEKHPNTRVILLDDAFQHRRLRAGLNILLTDYSRPFYRDFLFPVGYLREGRRGKKRAQMILVTKCPRNISEEEKKNIVARIRPAAHQQVFFTYMKSSALLGLNSGRELKFSPDLSVLLVTGIANPDSLYAYLKKNFRQVEHLEFGDHHDFGEGDVEKIKAAFHRLPGAGKVIITTEKDAMRMSAAGFSALPVYYLPMEISLLGREGDFHQIIRNYVQSFKPKPC